MTSVAATEQSVADLMSQGIAARDAGNFVLAEERFRAVLDRQPKNTDALLLLGLVLGYQERHAAGLELLERGIDLAPEREDLRVARARLLAWSNRTADAEAQISDVLSRAPNHAEALKVQAWLKRSEGPPTFPYTASLSLARSHFERRALARWYEARLGLGYAPDETWSIDGALRQSRRHGLVDHNVDAGLRYRFDRDAGLEVRGEWTQAAEFLPQWGLSLSGDAVVWKGMDSGWVGPTSLSLALRHRHYKTVQINNVDPGVVQYFADGQVWLSATGINAFDNSVDGKLTGWSLKLDVDLHRWMPLRAYVLRAHTPETDLGVTVTTDTVGAGLIADITDRLGLRLDYTRDDRSGSYLRHEFGLGAVAKF